MTRLILRKPTRGLISIISCIAGDGIGLIG